MLFRQGRHNPQTVYLQKGPEPSDDDEYVLTAVGGRVRGAYFAAMVVQMNRELIKIEEARAGLPPNG